jgi:hypothetical protein
VCQTDLDFADDKILEVFEMFLSRKSNKIHKPESEFVVTDGQVYNGRYFPHPIPEELIKSNLNSPIVLTV